MKESRAKDKNGLMTVMPKMIEEDPLSVPLETLNSLSVKMHEQLEKMRLEMKRAGMRKRNGYEIAVYKRDDQTFAFIFSQFLLLAFFLHEQKLDVFHSFESNFKNQSTCE